MGVRSEKRVVFTGGGSGGHTMPALAVAKEFINKLSLFYIGSKNGIENSIIKTQLRGIPYYPISTGKLRRYISFKNFIDIFKVFLGIVESFFILIRIKPDLIFSTGGFVSVPPVIAARILRIKIIIHEQTIDAGLANKISAKFADRILLTFEESRKHFDSSKTFVTGIPLRKEIFGCSKRDSISYFGFNNDPVIFITGGGLGCAIINEAVIQSAEELLSRFNLIVQTGNSADGGDYKRMVELKNTLSPELNKKIRVYNFITDDLNLVYGAADLAVGRSGAGTVNELAALRIPAVYIPLAIATGNEQFKNADAVKKLGGAIIIEEDKFTPVLLRDTIESVVFTDKLSEMKQSMERVFNNNGLEAVVQHIKEIIGE